MKWLNTTRDIYGLSEDAVESPTVGMLLSDTPT